jgi:FixJ family two-component response regulator
MTSARAKVLVVEDDDSMRDAIDHLLNLAGLRCAAYASADALLQEGVDKESVCVVSDLRLPGMSGLELLCALRERNVLLPFILITAHDAPELRQKAIGSGVSAYLAKPFSGTALLDAVRRVIEPQPPS